MQYGGEFQVLEDRFVYNNEKEVIYEFKNLQAISGSRLEYGDLYINGALIVKEVPLIYHDTGAGNSLQIDYQGEKSELHLRWRDGDGCGYMK